MAQPAPESRSPHQLVYDQPGHPHRWHDHLIVGNGSLGAAVRGGVGADVLRLNHECLWQRNPQDRVNPQAREQLPEVRRLLAEGRPREAEQLADAALMAMPRRVRPYQPLGRLMIDSDVGGPASDYTRWLDMDRAVAHTRFALGDAVHHRRCFASAPADVIVLRHELASPPHATLPRTVFEFSRPVDYRVHIADGDQWDITGRAGEHGSRYAARLALRHDGGELRAMGDRLVLEGATGWTVLIACETDYWTAFRGMAEGDTPWHERPARRVGAAADRTLDALLEQHVADHQRYYRRAGLQLGDDPPAASVPDLMHQAAQGPAPDGLLTRQWNFARYALIGSSRPGGLPANLQGIWCDQLTPAWNCDFHTNINLQMNYWPAEAAGLGELHTPMLDWLAFAAGASGRRTAREHYDADGWVMHHVSDPWGFTGPGDAAGCGLWPTGGAWCALHAWEHWLHRRDLDRLRDQVWPLLRGAAEFLLDFLQPAADGTLISGPSVSPENRYIARTGQRSSVCMGPTMDHQIARELFAACRSVADTLGLTDEPLLDRIADAADRLPPERIGRHGTLQEWARDDDEADPGHRHMSHLFGLFPGTTIDPAATPELADAARRTIQRRLAHQDDAAEAGWSYAWKACIYARLRDGDAAAEALDRLARHCTQPNLLGNAHGQTQIDCTLGMAAGLQEMLLQSHRDVVTLLPALPGRWPDGSFTGWTARGGVRVDATWSAGHLTSATLRTSHTQQITLADGTRSAEPRALDLQADEPLTLNFDA
jgi:alpha-L-fucosidase 2